MNKPSTVFVSLPMELYSESIPEILGEPRTANCDYLYLV